MQFAAFISSTNLSKHRETPNSKILLARDQGEVKSCNSDCRNNLLVLSHSANLVMSELMKMIDSVTKSD